MLSDSPVKPRLRVASRGSAEAAANLAGHLATQRARQMPVSPATGIKVTRYDRTHQFLAICFAALAGFVDAIGFLRSGGMFVSFMSGNTTRLAVGMANGAAAAGTAAMLIGLFVLGVMLNVLLSAAAGAHRKAVAASIVAGVLVGSGIATEVGQQLLGVCLLCLAMGAANAIFQRDGDVSIGLTYMTGALVKLGYRLADAFQGRRLSAWLPQFALWFALLAGGFAGALLHGWEPDAGIWVASAWATVLALAIRAIGPAPGSDNPSRRI